MKRKTIWVALGLVVLAAGWSLGVSPQEAVAQDDCENLCVSGVWIQAAWECNTYYNPADCDSCYVVCPGGGGSHPGPFHDH